VRTSSAKALSVRNLSYSIRGLSIVRDFSLDLEPGSVLGLIGPNGAGKTTLMDLLSGLSRPTRGSVWIGGRDITHSPPYSRVSLGLARTFQESPGVHGLTVYELLRLSCESGSRFRDPSSDASPDSLLEKFALADVRDVPSTDLDTSRKRLLDFARALGTRPCILLLDEPFSGLEEGEVDLIGEEIRKQQVTGGAVIIVEHRLAILSNIAPSAVVMVAGSRVAEGALSAVLEIPRVQEAYLGRIRPGGGGDSASQAAM
jgi:branched-chain amino acid transport system ATP-binding protein